MRLNRAADHSWDAPAPRSNLTELELAWGLPLGYQAGTPALAATGNRTPRQAFEAVVERALRRPPCVVSFSGGRDSSVTLALATSVARRAGLPLPIPATHRFAGVADSEESAWQELVVSHLGLDDWQILQWDDELDSVGPFARRTLRELGVTAPSNQHFLLPFIDLAPGGSLLTGVSGDEIFELRDRPTTNRFLFGGGERSWRHVRGVLPGLAPLAVRARHSRVEQRLDYRWIQAGPMAELARRVARWIAQTPLRYDRAVVTWLWQSRIVQLSRQQSGRLGRAHDTVVEHPFSDPGFLADFAGSVGPAGPLGRARGLRALAGDLLPDQLFSRTSKASFDGVFNSRWTRSFAQAWDGHGLNEHIIDPDQARREWLSPHPEPHSLLLLQAAWLASAEGRGAQTDRVEQ